MSRELKITNIILGLGKRIVLVIINKKITTNENFNSHRVKVQAYFSTKI